MGYDTESRPARLVVYGLFLFSGLTALVYQTVWMRQLTLTFGASTFAVAAVLIAFMGGMSAGAFLLGRWGDSRSDQVLVYGLLELAIGLYALAVPALIEYLSRLYVWIYQAFTPGFYSISLIRLAASVLILLLPTAAMGGTLPILCSAVARHAGQASRRTAVLYGINTFGALLGCVLAGFVLIPVWGLNGATWLCVGINCIIGLTCIALHRRHQRRTTTEAASSNALQPPKRRKRVAGRASARPGTACSGSASLGLTAWTAIIIVALSGFTAMAYETLWTRVFSMIIGTTVYAFTTMLAAFLMGIVLGNLLFYLRPPRRPAMMLAISQATIGLWILLVLPYCDELPFLLVKIFAWSHQNWILFQVLRFGLLSSMLLVPTTLAGLSFPLAVQIVIQQNGETGRRVGYLYGFNTVGAIGGAFVGGFVLIPFVGLQQGLIIGAAVNISSGLAMLVAASGGSARARATTAGAIVAAAIAGMVLLAPWDLCYLNSGAYVYAPAYRDSNQLRAVLRDYQPVFYREGPTATVAVVRSPEETLSLTIEGKTDASTGQNADMSTQILLAHLPALIAPQQDQALLIGLGSGVSLGSLLCHPVDAVDVVEISEGVVQASRCFSEYNHDALNDERVNLVVGDGRHHLQRSSRRYDLIISQPSNPWITGNANLFTREYYELMAGRLNDGGIACQWLPSYQMSRKMVAVIIKTFSQQFKHVTVWTSSVVGDLFLIGSQEPLRMEYREFEHRLHEEGVNADLARIDMNTDKMLAFTFKFGPDDVESFLAEFGPSLATNTDTHPIIEFACPRYLLQPHIAREFDSLDNLRGHLKGLANMIRFKDATRRAVFLSRMQAAATEYFSTDG